MLYWLFSIWFLFLACVTVGVKWLHLGLYSILLNVIFSVTTSTEVPKVADTQMPRASQQDFWQAVLQLIAFQVTEEMYKAQLKTEKEAKEVWEKIM